jgi:hypothetical protein
MELRDMQSKVVSSIDDWHWRLAHILFGNALEFNKSCWAQWEMYTLIRLEKVFSRTFPCQMSSVVLLGRPGVREGLSLGPSGTDEIWIEDWRENPSKSGQRKMGRWQEQKLGARKVKG